MKEAKKSGRKKSKEINEPKMVEDDPRFQHVFSEAKFRRIPKMERKVKVDSRFKGMFEEPQFKLTYKRDKRGRAISKTSSEDLKKFYELNSDEEEENENDDRRVKSKQKIEKPLKSKTKHEIPSDQEESDDEDTDGGNVREDLDLKLDLARGEGNMESSSSSDEDEADEDWEVAGKNDLDGISHDWWGEVDKDAPQIEEATSRLAVCNMNWDRMKARDILILLSSFKPAEGRIHSVSIYPSEFGKERMAEEKLKGPAELRGDGAEEEVVEEETEEGKEEEQKKLTERIRLYQLQRLKYYYAVVECDGPTTANAIYEGCNGVEYETSGELVDLRFIPDDMTFDEEAEDTANKIGDPDSYRPKQFVDSALQMSSAQLTWDETDPERLRKTRETFDQDFEELEDKDFGGLIASGSSDEEEEAEPKPAFRNLMDIVKKSDGRNSLFSKRSAPSDSDEGNPETAPDHVSSGSGEEDGNPKPLTKTKKIAKKNKKKGKLMNSPDPELSLLVSEETTKESKKHYNLSKLIDIEKKQNRKKKRKVGENSANESQDPFSIDAADPRFGAIYDSHLYNIDPSDPSFKQTAGMKTLVQKKSEITRKRREEPNIEVDETKRNPSQNDSVMLLADSLKSKVSKLEQKKASNRKQF